MYLDAEWTNFEMEKIEKVQTLLSMKISIRYRLTKRKLAFPISQIYSPLINMSEFAVEHNICLQLVFEAVKMGNLSLKTFILIPMS